MTGEDVCGVRMCPCLVRYVTCESCLVASDSANTNTEMEFNLGIFALSRVLDNVNEIRCHNV